MYGKPAADLVPVALCQDIHAGFNFPAVAVVHCAHKAGYFKPLGSQVCNQCRPVAAPSYSVQFFAC
ncbi:hypothetical protein WS94_01315 [Burkholderia territorii]|nr:hypothetical protein WS94_01315 [Burkholderia territorii]